ncbi:alpha/beta fold hydrolase [Streptomyces sp. NBC_01485]|uniref:thioesterase II family protein n=1 Tax=Streptomyces sp. NBC_01485 TaxID=2903884 RepID=UPI002E317361|nr:alpha/beta fold hydrolase [Streptomyces sp. NBC_01485]
MTRVSAPETWLTLYCLPHAGGSAQPYAGLATAVPPGVRVVPLELPGHGRRLRERPLREMGQVVTEVIRLMGLPGLPESPDLTGLPDPTGEGDGRGRPFALFGHSFGALVGYETTRRLRQLGTPPELLLVSARNSPVWPLSHEPLHALADPSFTAGVSRMGGIPQALLAQPAVLQVFLPSLRADLRMVETYAHTHREPLDVPIAAFVGLQDRLTDPAGMAAWAEQTSRPFDLTPVRAGHFFLDEPEFRTALAARLARLAPPAGEGEGDDCAGRPVAAGR